MKKSISILGSTGSVGLSTLKIIDKKKNFFNIIHLAANNNYNLICKQIKKYKPKYFIINPMQTELIKKHEQRSYIDKKFYEKIMWLKEISDNLKRAKARRVF